MSELLGKRVVVIGLGASGVAAARLCRRRGARVVATDQKPADALSREARKLADEGIELAVGGHDAAGLTEADLIVISPGVPPFPALLAAERAGVPIWGEVELAVRSLAYPAPVVAVGGTNGKSTTTTLIGEILRAHGAHAFVGGNLGEPLSERADDRFDAIVLEVSSFQMERVEKFRPRVSLVLNITPDHLDRYASLEEYARAKGNAFARQTPDDVAVIPVGDSLSATQAARGKGKVVTFGPGGDIDVREHAVVDMRTGDEYLRSDFALTGGHNAMNVAASVACARAMGVSPDVIRKVLGTFRGLPHRTAFVAEVRGVRYYDDSKATNVGAAVTALVGLREPKAVLVAGGRDKGGSYAPLVDALVAKGRAAVVMGEAADAIAAAIQDRIPVRRATSMEEAVRIASELASPGDAVLLSPACSSYDMFRDYKHRGDAFVSAVRGLVAQELGEVGA